MENLATRVSNLAKNLGVVTLMRLCERATDEKSRMLWHGLHKLWCKNIYVVFIFFLSYFSFIKCVCMYISLSSPSFLSFSLSLCTSIIITRLLLLLLCSLIKICLFFFHSFNLFYSDRHFYFCFCSLIFYFNVFYLPYIYLHFFLLTTLCMHIVHNQTMRDKNKTIFWVIFFRKILTFALLSLLVS